MTETLVKPTITVNPKIPRYVPAMPKGLVVVVDSREQLPYKLAKIVKVVKKLDFGDYSIAGFENQISIERKSQDDFYGSIVNTKKNNNARDRFTQMLIRMQVAEFKGLLIDCEEAELLTPELSYSDVNANSVYGTLISLEVKFGLHVYYGTKRDCEQKLLNWLGCFYKMKRSV